MRSLMKRRPRSLASSAAMISPAVSWLKACGQLRVRLGLLLHLPQRFDRVPVAVVGAVLQPAQQRVVDLAVRLLHDRAQVQRRGQLGEVEHPVDLPVAIVDVDRVLQQHRQLRQRHLVLAVQLLLEELEVALHLRHEPVVPPVDEVLAVDGQRRVEVLADALAVLGIERHPRAVSGAVLHRVDRPAPVRRDGRGVQVAVDVLDDPVGRERRPEAAEHVVARQPPAADLLEHRAQRVRAVQVVEDPEELLSRARCATRRGSRRRPGTGRGSARRCGLPVVWASTAIARPPCPPIDLR